MYPLQNLQIDEFSVKKELGNPIYQYDDSEDEYRGERMAYERQRRFANPNSNRRGRFPNPNRGASFLIIIMVEKEGT